MLVRGEAAATHLGRYAVALFLNLVGRTRRERLGALGYSLAAGCKILGEAALCFVGIVRNLGLRHVIHRTPRGQWFPKPQSNLVRRSSRAPSAVWISCVVYTDGMIGASPVSSSPTAIRPRRTKSSTNDLAA
jgi:hypothetical protein